MQGTTLTHASNELFRRPPEEHFASFESLRADADAQRDRCREVAARDLEILFGEDGVHFGDETLALTHYSLSQMATHARVPMSLLGRLRPETRTTVLNQCYERGRRFKIGLADGCRLRAVTSDRYERVWDAELYEAVDRWLLPSGFVPAVPTMNTDEHGTNVLGNTKPALFRSDRDSFAFFFSEESNGAEFGGLRKGVLAYNSEVGAKCLGYATFLFRDVCSNFLIWSASEVVERQARHTSRVRELFSEFDRELREIANTVSPLELRLIDKAATTEFVTKGDHAAAMTRLQREFRVPKRLIGDVIDAVFLPENPGELTAWGIANGITSVAKTLPYADDRAALSRIAGEVLSVR